MGKNYDREDHFSPSDALQDNSSATEWGHSCQVSRAGHTNDINLYDVSSRHHGPCFGLPQTPVFPLRAVLPLPRTCQGQRDPPRPAQTVLDHRAAAGDLHHQTPYQEQTCSTMTIKGKGGRLGVSTTSDVTRLSPTAKYQNNNKNVYRVSQK